MPLVVAAPLKVSRSQRVELEWMARSSSLPHRVVVQASALLLAADGTANESIARECATTADTVRRWRAKFVAGGVEAVGSIAPGRGRKPETPQNTSERSAMNRFHPFPTIAATRGRRARMPDGNVVSRRSESQTSE